MVKRHSSSSKRHLWIAAAVFVGIVSFMFALKRQQTPDDSAAPEFAAVEKRVKWMSRRLRPDPPSKIADAHFKELIVQQRHSHMGPAGPMSWFHAKIELDAAEGEAWAALSKPVDPPPWKRDLNPLLHPTAKWGMPAADFDGAKFYDPAPLVGGASRWGYQAGYMIIPADGQSVYIWQHWR
jgi:hypothetical protein